MADQFILDARVNLRVLGGQPKQPKMGKMDVGSTLYYFTVCKWVILGVIYHAP